MISTVFDVFCQKIPGINAGCIFLHHRQPVGAPGRGVGIHNNVIGFIRLDAGSQCPVSADIIIAVDVIAKSVLPKKIGNMVQTLVQSTLILQKELQKLKKNHHDILIQPELGERKQTDYHGDVCKEIIELGRVATLKQIDKIKELIKK